MYRCIEQQSEIFQSSLQNRTKHCDERTSTRAHCRLCAFHSSLSLLRLASYSRAAARRQCEVGRDVTVGVRGKNDADLCVAVPDNRAFITCTWKPGQPMNLSARRSTLVRRTTYLKRSQTQGALLPSNTPIQQTASYPPRYSTLQLLPASTRQSSQARARTSA